MDISPGTKGWNPMIFNFKAHILLKSWLIWFKILSTDFLEIELR